LLMGIASRSTGSSVSDDIFPARPALPVDL